MSSRYGRLFVALGGLALAGNALAQEPPHEAKHHQQRADARKQIARDDEGVPPLLTIAKSLEAIARNTVPPVKDEASAAKESQRADQQLKADQAAARWAFWAVIATAIQIPLTAFGIWLVRETLAETRAAVADANEATRIMRQDFEMRFKPWLIPKIEGPFFRGPDLHASRHMKNAQIYQVHLVIGFTNRSEIPAVIVGAEVEIPNSTDILLAKDLGATVLAKGETAYLNMVGTDPTNGELSVCEHFGAVKHVLKSNLKDAPEPRIVCRVRYIDPLGIVREVGFAFSTWHTGIMASYKRWGGSDYNYDRQV
jgi:hypothetical protein